MLLLLLLLLFVLLLFDVIVNAVVAAVVVVIVLLFIEFALYVLVYSRFFIFIPSRLVPISCSWTIIF